MKNRLMSILKGLLLSTFLCIPPSVAADTYGPTKANETLWSIASRLRPTYAVSTQQMMLAIRARNPQAFENPNINSLKKGVILQLPTLAEIHRLDRVQAFRITRQHNISWNDYPYPHTATKPRAATHYAAKPRTKTTSPKHLKSRTYLQREVSTLRQQLKNEQQHSARLSAQIKTLEASEKTSQQAPPQEIKQLQAQVIELKATLDEKNNHIKNLQASLKEASESIKRQYAESQMLYDKLNAVSPNSLPPSPSVSGSSSPKLTLSGVGNDQTADDKQASTSGTPTNQQQVSEKPPVFTDQIAANQQKTVDKTEPATDTKPANPSEHGKVPLKQLLEEQAAQMAQNQTSQAEPVADTLVPTGNNKSTTGANVNAPSRLSLIVALASLLFILALLWRAFSQRSQRIETEKQDKTHRQDTPSTPPQQTEIDPKTKVDGRKEPDILL